MPELFFEARETLRKDCDFLLVAGSSLVVYPVADLPRLAKKLIVINLEPTVYDSEADVVIREKCGQALTELLGLLK